MEYLLEYGFSTTEIEKIKNNNPFSISLAIEDADIVIENINYFKNLGIDITYSILSRFLDLFLIDNDKIKSRFEKIGKERFINELNESDDIFELLMSD